MPTDFLTGITILLTYQLIGEVSTRLLQLPVPGPVIGMVLLFVTLLLRGTLEKTLDSAASALLSHLSLLFVPAGVGVIVHFSKIRDEWLPLTVALLLSAVITLAATALIMLAVSRLLGQSGKHDANR
ncbi:MAG: CidA/LrgA family protein [Thiolinea sp.]